MKKFLTFLFTFFLFNSTVSAASLCSYKEQSELNKKASNIKVNYEIVKKDEYYDDEVLSYSVIDISILNLTEEFYLVATNDINDEEKTFTINDIKDGVITYRWEQLENVTNFTFKAYSTDKTSCPNESYKTIYLTTPRYNFYSQLEICNVNSDFYLCHEFVTFKNVSEDKLLTDIDKFENGEINKDGVKIANKKKKNNSNKEDDPFAWFGDHLWYIVGGLVIIAALTTSGVVIYKKMKKKVKTRNRGI